MEKIQINSVLTLGYDTSGRYDYLEMLNNKPAYKHETRDFYLFYAGWWKVDVSEWYNSPDKAAVTGLIRSEEDVACPELVDPGYWKYYDDSMVHSTISVTHGNSGTVSHH